MSSYVASQAPFERILFAIAYSSGVSLRSPLASALLRASKQVEYTADAPSNTAASSSNGRTDTCLRLTLLDAMYTLLPWRGISVVSDSSGRFIMVGASEEVVNGEVRKPALPREIPLLSLHPPRKQFRQRHRMMGLIVYVSMTGGK